MKIIDAVWDKKNLGVSTVEVVIEKNDTPESFENIRSVISDYEYGVIKVPVNMALLTNKIQNDGYRFIESAVTMHRNPADFIIPERYEKLYRSCDIKIMDSADIAQMYDEIEKGIIRTDRISLDDYFPKEISNDRYANWMKDMIESGEKPYEVIYQNNTVGFFLFKKREGDEFHGVLSGVYDGYERFGMGMMVAIAETDVIRKCGGKKYYTHFSSNNLPNIRLHESLGFVVEEVLNVFIKHKM